MMEIGGFKKVENGQLKDDNVYLLNNVSDNF